MEQATPHFEASSLDLMGQEEDWRPHPAFPGVRLKPLLGGGQSGGTVSSLMVRIDPGCGLDEHVHSSSGETHHILAGAGAALVAGERLDYEPGRVAFIPAGSPHGVTAGETGLVLLAVFSPALE